MYWVFCCSKCVQLIHPDIIFMTDPARSPGYKTDNCDMPKIFTVVFAIFFPFSLCGSCYFFFLDSKCLYFCAQAELACIILWIPAFLHFATIHLQHSFLFFFLFKISIINKEKLLYNTKMTDLTMITHFSTHVFLKNETKVCISKIIAGHMKP